MENNIYPSLELALRENKISLKTFERVKIAKSYIEKKYKMKKMKEEEKRKDWELINQKISELNLNDNESNCIKKAILHKEAENSRLNRQKMSIRDFESLALIGRGAFGEVRVCRYKETGEVFALKKMKKSEMKNKNQVFHIRTEKEVLSEANNPWIVGLNYSFQDEEFLYLVMDYLPGGDLMNLLMVKDILTEEETRFYTAELILAIESVHKMNYIHRDIKPDNVLIDRNGHLKLSDFGLSKKIDVPIYENVDNLNSPKEVKNILRKSVSLKRKKRILAHSTVGSPDYIAPEVIANKGYDAGIDWWSLGVIIFEMLCGYAPFTSESPQETCKKIINYKKYLQYPKESVLSKEAKDIINKLVTDVENRLGYNGADEIKKHPFFKGIDFNNIRKSKPPFIPQLSSDHDTKYFDTFPEEDPFYPLIKNRKNVTRDTDYINFTYKRNLINDKSHLISAIEMLDSLKQTKKLEKNSRGKPIKQNSAGRLRTLNDSHTAADSNENLKQIGCKSDSKKEISSEENKDEKISVFNKALTIEINEELNDSKKITKVTSPTQMTVKNSSKIVLSINKNKLLSNSKISPKNQVNIINKPKLNKIIVNKNILLGVNLSPKVNHTNHSSPKNEIKTKKSVEKLEFNKISPIVSKEASSTKNVIKTVELNILNHNKRKPDENTKKDVMAKDNEKNKDSSTPKNELITSKCYVNEFLHLETKQKIEGLNKKNNKLVLSNQYVKNILKSNNNKVSVQQSNSKVYNNKTGQNVLKKT